MEEQHIYQPNKNFQFQLIELCTPTLLQSTQFIKMKINNGNVLIQTPKCLTKQGIVFNSKKSTADLLFNLEENDSFFQWIESLESYCQNIIFEKRHQWFDANWVNNIQELNDVNEYFKNILKSVKGTPYHSMTVSIPNDLTIYDEHENVIDVSKIIGEQTPVLCILEYEGIRCHLSHFQIQIKVRQMMTLQPMFSKCLIKKTYPLGNNLRDDTPSLPPSPLPLPFNHDNVAQEPPLEYKIEDANIEEMEDVVHIKDRMTICKELYKDAKEKAKRAKHLALMSYLEKKEIKNTYMLEDIESSDEDDDL